MTALFAGILIAGACALILGLYMAGRHIISDAVKALFKAVVFSFLPAILKRKSPEGEAASHQAVREGRNPDQMGREK